MSHSENPHGSAGVISGHLKEDIDHWLAKFPPDRRRSAVLAALRAAQHENNGFLTKELMDGIAEYIGLPPIQVYEVATFYSMFETKPVGRVHVSICTNISCMLCGSDEIVAAVERDVAREIDEAVAFAEAGTWEPVGDLLRFVHSEGAGR